MPENWRKYSLGDLSEDISYGYTESASKEEVGPKFLRITDIQNDFIDWNEVPYCKISEKDLIKYQVEIGDIVVARTGNSTGATSMIKNEINAVYASYLIRYRLNQKIAFPGFIDFVLRSNSWKNYVDAIKGGSAQPGANAKQFAAFEINLPPLQEQKCIASILSALDDKIELNLQMNKTLEEMAMALYKHWFVDFGPFQDGEFVDSELGEIPKGWEVQKLKDYIKNSQYGFTQSSSPEKIGPKFLRITDIQGGTVNWDDVPYCKTTGKEFEKYKIVKGDIFVARTGNSTGENVYTLKPQKAVFASYLIRFQFQELHQACYIAKIFRSKSFSDFINGAKVGSAQPGISASALGELQILIPPDSVLQSYFEIVNPFDFKRETVFEENQTLTQLRDTLLPKLISGEVRVKDAEKTLTEVL